MANMSLFHMCFVLGVLEEVEVEFACGYQLGCGWRGVGSAFFQFGYWACRIVNCINDYDP
jgi:hypothetical protein